MEEVGTMFVFYEEEFCSFSEWKAVHSFERVLKPVNLDDIEPQNLECDICRQSFGPSDDGTSQEEPVSLPCGHIFGKDCISGWIASHAIIAGPPVATAFTCPKCRKDLTAPGETQASDIETQARMIEGRLRFWDFVSEKLGILKLVEVEIGRKFLWHFVEEQKREQNTESWDLTRPWFDFLAQQSGLRIALQHRRYNGIPAHRDFYDAIFNIACCGLNDASEMYRAESYEDRLLPRWCWQFEQISRQQSPSFYLFEHLRQAGRQPRIGPWRRAMYQRMENEVMAQAIDDVDRPLRNPDGMDTIFSTLNDIAPVPNDPSYPE